MKLIIYCAILHTTLVHIYCDWLSEWAAPVKAQLSGPSRPDPASESSLARLFQPDADVSTFELGKPVDVFTSQLDGGSRPDLRASKQNLKNKLRVTLDNAKALAETLRKQIAVTEERESSLKDAIVNGRNGVTLVKVTGLGKLPRSYLVRDGRWSACDGIIQHPVGRSEREYVNDFVETPTCAGREMATSRDVCSFNSVIKYETIPVTRGEEYAEDDYVCLKYSSNSVQRFLSVPRKIVNDTCSNGVVQTLQEQNARCGSRTVSEYAFYPARPSTSLPLEYCKNGVCKLIVAWHITNDTVDNVASFSQVEKFNKLFSSERDLPFEF